MVEKGSMPMMAWWDDQPSDVVTYPPGGQGVRRIIERDRRLAREGFQQPGMGAFFLAPSVAAHGICWLQHGMTAGPYQFWQLAQHLVRAGWYVFAARLPGHGYLRGDREDGRLLPRSTESQRYLESASTALRAVAGIAHAHPQGPLPIVAVGLSGGAVGILGVLGQPHMPKIHGVVLVAPYIQPYAYAVQTVFRSAKCLDVLGVAGRVLDRIPYGWNAEQCAAARAWGRPGHLQFCVGNMYALEKAKDQALRALLSRTARQKNSIPKMLLVVTDGDRRISTPAAIAYVNDIFGADVFQNAQKSLQIMRFPEAQGVPHAMLSPMEYPDNLGRDQIIAAITAFVTKQGQE